MISTISDFIGSKSLYHVIHSLPFYFCNSDERDAPKTALTFPGITEAIINHLVDNPHLNSQQPSPTTEINNEIKTFLTMEGLCSNVFRHIEFFTEEDFNKLVAMDKDLYHRYIKVTNIEDGYQIDVIQK